MKSITHGKAISGVEVTHISKHGIWLATKDHELFISFKQFPPLSRRLRTETHECGTAHAHLPALARSQD